jgi:hypothetical protein
MADWRELYKTILLETNPTQLERLTTETEDAIFQCRRELAGSSDNKKECLKLAEASVALWTLNSGKLCWTDRKIKSV